jgi:hypothetical protein
MARQDAGKWVARAGSTGGGRTYRARVPYRWYSGLALIVVVGIFLVGYSRYENFHPAASPASIAPTTSDHWVVGIDFDLCGTNQQTLPASPNATSGNLGIYSSGDGVIQIQPKSSKDSGTNATVGRFASQYPGLTLTANSVGLPKKQVYTNGSKCPSGTPDAGKTGTLAAYVWSTADSTSPQTQSGDVRTVRFLQPTQLVTLAFVPSGASVARSQSLAEDVLNAETVAAQGTTTTTAPVTSTTTSKSTTTTAKGTTTTTAKGSTTTSSTAGTTTTTTSAGTTTTTK